MKHRFTFLILILFPTILFSQENTNFGIKFSGFVKTDIFYDSRQTIDLREGHFLILPKNESFDANNEDINSKPSFNILSIQTRLNGDITGPDVLGAKSSGYIESEFFGTSNNDVNGFRLRHAYAMLNWKKSELLIGQFWHPMFITSCFPATLSFNTGAPFQPFSRNPQIRYTFKMNKVNIIASVVSQRDFQNMGPNKSDANPTGASPEYIRNAGIPEENLKIEYKNANKESGKELLLGAGIDFKLLQPLLYTTYVDKQTKVDTFFFTNPMDTLIISNTTEKKTNYSTNEKVRSISLFAYCKLKFKPLTIKLQGIYGQSTDNLTMLGGYAVTDIFDKTKNAITYSPMNIASAWTDIHTNGEKWEFGIFGGYSKNLGFDKNIVGDFYGRGSDISYVYRYSPRAVYKTGKMKFAAELENTVAAYGKVNKENKGEVTDTKEISNIRVLLGVYYYF